MSSAESQAGVTLDRVLPGEGLLSFIDLAILKANTHLLVLSFISLILSDHHDETPPPPPMGKACFCASEHPCC